MLLAAAGASVLGAALVGGFALLGGGEESRVRIEPADGLLDAPLRFEVDDLDEGSRVRLTLSATAADGVQWTGTRTVRADENGSVSVDGGPLIASLRPTGPRAGDRELCLCASGNELVLRLEARQDERLLGTRAGVASHGRRGRLES